MAWGVARGLRRWLMEITLVVMAQNVRRCEELDFRADAPFDAAAGRRRNFLTAGTVSGLTPSASYCAM